jgi:hypothetical protein
MKIMKKIYAFTILIFLILIFSILVSGCVNNNIMISSSNVPATTINTPTIVSSSTEVKAGDRVNLELTVQKGNIVFDSPITIIAGQTLEQSLYSLNGKYAIFKPEFDTISSEIIGMKLGEQKNIQVPTNNMEQSWSAEILRQNNKDISTVNIGDTIEMGINDVTINPSSRLIRVGTITNKNPNGVIVDFSYPSIQIKILQISPS